MSTELSANAPVWLVTLEGPLAKAAALFVCSFGSENDVREVARCRFGSGWNTSTADKTSLVGRAGLISTATFEGRERTVFHSFRSPQSTSVLRPGLQAPEPLVKTDDIATIGRRRPRP